MPLYEYRCRRCGREAETFRVLELRDRAGFCLACDLWSARRVITAPAIRGATVSKS